MSKSPTQKTNDRKIKRYLKLKKTWAEAMARVNENEGKALADYSRKLLETGCPHPDVYETTRNCDDGYGKWWTVTYNVCRVCGEPAPPLTK